MFTILVLSIPGQALGRLHEVSKTILLPCHFDRSEARVAE